MNKFGLDTTQMIAVGLVLLFLFITLKKVSGYAPLVQDPSDVDLNQYNARVSQYNTTWAQWLNGVISSGTTK
jgi:hypothetical protein